MAFRAIVPALIALALIAPSAAGAETVRSEFYGIVQGQFDADGQLDDQDLQGMQNARIHTDRFELGWRTVEPSQGTFKWAATDQFVGALASHGIRAVPFLWGSPRWVASSPGAPPIDTPAHEQAWKDFLQAAVGRYGPGGTYWSTVYPQQYGAGATPYPITAWQVWNEPNLKKFFDPSGTNATLAQKYAQLLRISHNAITGVDPNAQIVLAGNPGYPPGGGPKAWEFLGSLYAVPGIKNYFDVAALHPYASDLNHVQLEVGKYRTVMKNHGDASTPLWITELGWGSAPPDHFGINQGLQGQKSRLIGAYKLFLSHRAAWNLQRVYWFLWRDPDPNSQFAHRCSFCASAGVLSFNRTRKPSYSALVGFTADTKPPTASFTSGPASGAQINDPTPTFAFGSTDPGSTFQCRVDSAPFHGCPSRYTTPNLADGFHRVMVKATDATGNVSVTKARGFTVDTVPPAVTISSADPPNGSVQNQVSATFSFATNDPTATVRCQLDGNGFAPCSSPFARSGFADGAHTFQVRATDAAGNVGAATSTWTVDTVAPTVSFTSGPGDGSTSTDPRPSFGFSASESPVIFECQLDGGGFAACSSPYSAAGRLTNAQHTFEVEAIDRAGNESPVMTRTWTVDAPPLDVRISSGPARGSLINDPTPSFHFTSSDSAAHFRCRFDADAFEHCPASYTTRPRLSDGAHTLFVKAVDGPDSSLVASRSFRVDSVAPQVHIAGPRKVRTRRRRASARFTLQASEKVHWRCRITPKRFETCSSPYRTPKLGDGPHVLVVEATDMAGNVTRKRKRFSIVTRPAKGQHRTHRRRHQHRAS
jgi:Bacterial Ig-like domain